MQGAIIIYYYISFIIDPIGQSIATLPAIEANSPRKNTNYLVLTVWIGDPMPDVRDTFVSTGIRLYPSQLGETGETSRFRNDRKRVVTNMEKRNEGTNLNSPKQSLTGADIIAQKLLWVCDSYHKSD